MACCSSENSVASCFLISGEIRRYSIFHFGLFVSSSETDACATSYRRFRPEANKMRLPVLKKGLNSISIKPLV